jgi:Flp pilus assembly secretin CpaC
VLFKPTGRENRQSKKIMRRGAKRKDGEVSSGSLRRRRLASLGFAAAIAFPPSLLQQSRTYADDASSNPSPDNQRLSDSDMLKLGSSQYDNGQYEESLATLKQVNATALGDSDKKELADYLSKSQEAVTERQSARDEFQRGEDARLANQPGQAAADYRAVLSNPRADEGTRQKASEQLALVEAAGGAAVGVGIAADNSGGSNSAPSNPAPSSNNPAPADNGKAAYDRGVQEYKSGQWEQAKADFATSQQAGYSAGFLQASPGDYLQKIQDKENDALQKQAAMQVSEQHDQAKAAYDQARSEYRQGKWDDARRDFIRARDLGYKPGFLEGLSPSEYLSRMDEKQAEEARLNQRVQDNTGGTASGSSSASDQTVSLAESSTSSSTTPPPVVLPVPVEAPVPVQPDQSAMPQATDQQSKAAFQAQGLVDMGTKAEAAGSLQNALSDYSQAVSLDPTNSAAVEGRDRVTAKLGGGATGAGTALSQREREIQQIRDAITFKFNNALSDARAASTSGNFNEAENDIADAQAARDQDPSVFNESDLRRMDAGLASARSNLASARANNEEKTRAQATMESQQREKVRLQAAEQERKATIESLIKLSRTLVWQQNYEAALGVVDQILKLDPQNDYALGVRQLIEDKAILQEQARSKERFDYNYEKQLNNADEQLIPYDDVFRFPDNWPDISDMRDREVQDKSATKEDQAAQALLDKRLPTIQLSQVALTDAIDFLRDTTGANILVNWKALEAASIDKQTPVSVTLHDVKFSKVLDIILEQAGGGKLDHTIDEGVIYISTTDELNKAVVTTVYDIRDLLIDPNFTPTLPSVTVSGGGGGGGGGGGSSAISGAGQGSASANGPTMLLQDIEKKIQNTVAFNTWKVNDPNGYGQIDDFNNNLIITQTHAVHDQIRDLLAQLRESRALQITVEARFLIVGRHFVESVGIGLNAIANATSTLAETGGVSNSHVTPIPISSDNASFVAAPSTGVPGSLGSAPALSSVSAGFGNFLDNFQVNFVLEAVQASSNNSLVHAPRVTLWDGQGANIEQETIIPYVSSLNASVASGAAIATPVISTATDGVSLEIDRAVVTADRKFVTLDILPVLDQFGGFQTFAFQIAPAPSTSSIGTVVNTGAQAATLVVQEAIETVTAVHTRVTVPDGGTVLLGGVNINGETELEAGLPVLSKIPFLRRLTTSTSSAKDDQILLILVKPTIIVDKEIEDKNFPTLSANREQ